MNKLEFLEILERELQGLPQEECENVLEYYREYFEEAGIDRESEVIQELGDPQVLAAKIMGRERKEPHPQAQEKQQTQPTRKMSTGWMVTIAIVGFPLWITLAALAFSVVVTLAALIFSLGLGGAIMVLVGAVFAITGLFMIFTVGITSLFVSGMSLCIAGVGFLFLAAVSGLNRFAEGIRLRLIIIRIIRICTNTGWRMVH